MMKLKEKIHQSYFELTPAEKKVADHFLWAGADIIYETMNNIKEKTKVGDATIVRLCHKLGYSGFSDLKVEVAKEDYSSNVEQTGKSPYANIENALTKTIKTTLSELNQEALAKAVAAIGKAKRIYILGVGGSALSSKALESMLLRIGVRAQAVTDPHYQAQLAAITNSSDLFIVFSLTGRTKDTLEPLKIAKKNQAQIIAITTYPASPIALEADIVLETAVDDFLNGGSLIGRMSQLLIADVLVYEYEKLNSADTINAREKVVRAILNKRKME